MSDKSFLIQFFKEFTNKLTKGSLSPRELSLAKAFFLDSQTVGNDSELVDCLFIGFFIKNWKKINTINE